MDNSGGAKRTRRETAESDSTFRAQTNTPATPTTPTTPVQNVETEVVATTSPRDQLLEEEMERLGVDEGLKASLRLMSPDERAEVLNDIIRSQQQMNTDFTPEMERRFPPYHRFPLSLFFADPDMGFMIGDGSGGGAEDVTQLLPVPLPLQRLSGNESSEQSGNEGTGSPSRGAFSLRSQAGILRSNSIYLRIVRDLMRQQFLGLQHDIDDMSYEQLLELQERIGVVSKGISQAQIQQCIKEVPRPEEGSCVVCQSEWQESEEGDRIVELKVCGHIFHCECIEQWLKCNKTCPVCKREAL